MAKGNKGSKGTSKKGSKTSSNKILKKTSKSTSTLVHKLDSKIDVSEITMDILNQQQEGKTEEKKKSLLDHKTLKKDHDKDVETKENQKKDEGDLMKQLESIGLKI